MITLRLDAPTEIKEDNLNQPESVRILTAYPNPFNNSVNFSIRAPYSPDGDLSIYDITGRLVKKFDIPFHVRPVPITWDGRNDSGEDVSSGIYFAKYKSDLATEMTKVVLLR